MTRINSAIPVEKLTDEHLLAEHREIKRICDFYKKRLDNNNIKNIPINFTLNTGHVLFFVDKGLFTFNRYKEIYLECKKRNFNVSDYSSNWELYKKEHYNDYISTDKEKQLLINRIEERLINSTKKNWYYYGNRISKEKAVQILKS